MSTMAPVMPQVMCKPPALLGSRHLTRTATVCHILHGLQVGGAEVLAAALARRLGDQIRFVFICLDELGTLGAQLRSEGYPVHVLNRRPGVDWRCIAGLGALLRRERVDLVHAHQYTPFFYSLTARLLVRRLGIMFTEHGRHFPDYPRRKRICGLIECCSRAETESWASARRCGRPCINGRRHSHRSESP